MNTKKNFSFYLGLLGWGIEELELGVVCHWKVFYLFPEGKIITEGEVFLCQA